MTATLRLGLAATAVLFALAATQAPAQDFDPAVAYEVLETPQPTESPGKIEVVDVFWYGCPHCWRFLPHMESYEATKGDDVELRRLPAVFRPSWEVHARAFYTAALLGVEATLHRAVFEAIHKGKEELDTKEALQDFFVEHGVDGGKFAETMDSFAVTSLVQKSRVMQGRYGVRGTPTVIVNGKYRVTGRKAGSYENMVKVIRYLVDKERQQQMASR